MVFTLGKETKTSYVEIMIDPVTIGIAFTAAQSAIGGIKKAMALGKDINGLYGQFSAFFENCDKVHVANVKLQNSSSIFTEGQIRSMSLQTAMHSKALRDSEKDLKEMLIWSGNKDVWDHMQAERVRMYKERAEIERKMAAANRKAKEDILEAFLMVSCFSAVLLPVFFFSLAMLARS